MFLQVHTLTSYPASLLNRDEAGLAKRIPFGNASRLRVSSQCLKRHWRESLADQVDEFPDGLRTRHLFERSIAGYLEAKDFSPAIASAIASTMKEVLLSSKDESGSSAEEASEGKRTEAGESLQVKQAAYFSAPEIRFLQQVAEAAAKEGGDAKSAERSVRKRLTGSADKPKKRTGAQKKKLLDDFQAMLKSGGYGSTSAALTAALFGRFVTSDLLARVDAPVHVAHAFTVHGAASEMDYFTVVDDLNRDDETGAAHANQSELAAGIYYGYVVVDVPLLVSNLTGADRKDWRAQDPAAPRRVLDALLRAIPTVSPGAKLGSTAPYSRAELVLLEAGAQQPRTLANAFLEALDARQATMPRAAERMARYLERIDGMYGASADMRALATIHDAAPFAPLQPEALDRCIGRALDAAFAAPGA